MNRWSEFSLIVNFEGNYCLSYVLLYLNPNCYGNMKSLVTVGWPSLIIIIATFLCWLVIFSDNVACFCLYWVTFKFPDSGFACVILVLLCLFILLMSCLSYGAFFLFFNLSDSFFKMSFISQLEASSFRHPRIHSNPLLPSWVNRFASPQPGQPPVVVEGVRGTFTLENGVTRVSTSLFSNLNVKHMENKVLMGKLVGKQIEARTIKWKFGLTWGLGVKNLFYLDHFGHHWYDVEFIEQEEIEYVLDNRPWFVRGQIFHLEKWTTFFS